MQRDQAHRTNELLERIAKALEKGNTTKAVELSGENTGLLNAKAILDSVKVITDDYASKHPVDKLQGDDCKSETMYDCPCASCKENPTTTWSNKDLHDLKLHTDEGPDSDYDDDIHNDYLSDLVKDMNQIEYSNFHREESLSFAQDDAASMTNFIFGLEYEECLGAIKKALFISGDDDYVENYLGDDKKATNYVKDVLEHRSQDYDVDKCDDDCNKF